MNACRKQCQCDSNPADLYYQSFLLSTKVFDNIKITKPDSTKPLLKIESPVKKGRWEYTHYFIGYNRVIYLSKRQVECLQLLKSNSYKGIAEKLGLSVRTVEFYLKILREKLNCRNKYDLMRLA